MPFSRTRKSRSTLFLSWIFLFPERKEDYFIGSQGSPSNPYNLKLVSIHDCRQCVIMSSLDRGNLDNYLVDKSSVLCALSIRQIERKWGGFLSHRSLTGKGQADQNMGETKVIHHNRIDTLTTLSNSPLMFFTNNSSHLSL
jgi:hypothetical protein